MGKIRRVTPRFVCGQKVFYAVWNDGRCAPKKGEIAEVIVRQYGVFYRFDTDCVLIAEADIAETSHRLLRRISGYLTKVAKATMQSAKEWAEKNDPDNWPKQKE